MFIYIDTEFTTLMARIQNIKLISAGFVAENGQELYFELPNNYRESDCSYFVSEQVIPLLENTEGITLSSLDAVIKLKNWVECFDEKVTFLTDAPTYDWLLLHELFYKFGDNFPQNLAQNPFDVRSLRVETFIAEYFENNKNAIRHHALWDAKALAFACKS